MVFMVFCLWLVVVYRRSNSRASSPSGPAWISERAASSSRCGVARMQSVTPETAGRAADDVQPDAAARREIMADDGFPSLGADQIDRRILGDSRRAFAAVLGDHQTFVRFRFPRAASIRCRPVAGRASAA